MPGHSKFTMTSSIKHTVPSTHEGIPSIWICRYAQYIPSGGLVLDLACGNGRHTRWLAANNWRVCAVDRDAAALANLQHLPGVSTKIIDLEKDIWPLQGYRFDGIIVSRYLHRPLFPHLLNALKTHGVLIYETFMDGNERYGRPRNPDYLLRSNELLENFLPHLTIIAFEQGEFQEPDTAVVQRICAISEERGNC